MWVPPASGYKELYARVDATVTIVAQRSTQDMATTLGATPILLLPSELAVHAQAIRHEC